MTLGCTTQADHRSSLPEAPSARLFHCARCSSLMKICRCCDRGNVYCTECSTIARREARKQTARRYQQSPQGRLNHAERQRRYRGKQRVASEKVTHKGSSDELLVITKARRMQATQSLRDKEKQHPKITIFCDYCAAVCSQFLRRDFLE